MKKLLLELWRDIKRTRTRYLSILMIVALGVGFFVGVKVTCPDMLITANRYYREANLLDFRLMCNYGLTEEDVEATAAFEGVRQVEPGYSVDLFVGVGTAHEVTAKVLSYTDNDISRLTLLEGRLPENTNECVVENSTKTPDNFVIGETIRFSVDDDEELTDTLAGDTYTIVGIIQSPNYIGLERGNTTIGDGTIDTVIYVPEDAFTLEVYTDLYVTLEATETLDGYSAEYDAVIDEFIDKFEVFGEERAMLRHDDIMSEANEKLEEARQELVDGEAEAEKELSDALQELTDAEAELADAEQEIADAVKEIADGWVELRQQQADAEREIADAEQEIADGWEELRQQQADAEAEIADAEQEIADGWEELRQQQADAEAEIADAEQEIADGEQELADARIELENGWDEYNAGVDEFDSQMANAQREFDDAKSQIDAGFLELEQAKKTLDASATQIENGRKELLAAQKALDDQKTEALAQIEDYRTQILTGIEAQRQVIKQDETLSEEEKAAALQKLDQELESQFAVLELQKKAALDEIQSHQDEIDAQNATLDDAEKKMQEGRQEYENNYAKLLEMEQEYEYNYDLFLTEKADAESELLQARQELEDAEQTIAENEQKLADAQTELANAREELATEIANAEQELHDAEAALTDARIELATEIADAEQELRNAESELADARIELAEEIADAERELRDAESELADAQAELEDGKLELADGWAEYEDGKREAEAEILDAKQKLRDAENDVRKLEEGKFYVFTRDDYPGYADYDTDAERVDNVAKVFPIFFIVIAILVCLTNMTRMVDEQRTQLGTFKALGYTKGAIVSKYLIYALSATLFGSVIGLAIGFTVFPMVIFEAYRIMYKMPDIMIPVHWDYVILCTLAACAATGGATIAACYKELNLVPAQLMRPAAPKTGKKIWLEHFPFLWNRLGFIYKITLRNIFRYKKRMLMTVVGIAGCTALMVAGFGLGHAISSIVPRQFAEIFLYDCTVVLENDLLDEESEQALETALTFDGVSGAMLNQQTTVDAIGTTRISATVLVPHRDAVLADYVSLHERVSKNALTLSDDGAIINEKLAKRLGVSAGDVIEVTKDGKYFTIPVSGITENYTMNFIYMTETLYGEIFNKNAEYNMLLLNLADDAEQTAIAEQLIATDNVLGLQFQSDTSKKFEDLVGSLNYIVLVVIFSAGLLAFIVLHNLVNVNVAERIRELATIKVLGFRNGETTSYITRETIVTTLMGIAVGLPLGTMLERFVVSVAEVDAVMFAPDISATCYLWSVLLTFGFSLIVNFSLHFGLKKIDMVESLKSVE